MKRVILYTSPYEEIQFSNCSTKYEVLPYVVDDSANAKDLRELAKDLGMKILDRVVSLENDGRSLKITHSVTVAKAPRFDTWGKRDSRRPIERTRLGFITLAENIASKCSIEVDVACDGVLTQEQAYNILNYQAFDFQDFITLDGKTVLSLDSWGAFHHLNMLGYSLDQFMKLYDTDETIFSDSVTQCSKCGEWMYENNGHTYNYRMIDCDLLGLECGCYAEYVEDNWQDRINDVDTPIELEVAETLEEQKKIKHLERFIGGMVDGRGGFYGGKSTREGDPAKVLAEYQKKYPKADFIFTHDESGQFQTYFSIWRVI